MKDKGYYDKQKISLIFCLIGITSYMQAMTLYQIVQDGNLIQVKRLIDDGKDVNATDGEGYTPLHWIVIYSYEHGGIARLLLQHTPNLNILF